MACINVCTYCKCGILDSEYHEECRGKFLEDLLLQVKKALEEEKFSSDLRERIKKLSLDSLVEKEQEEVLNILKHKLRR